jgi:AcrR family transcriptional regulator
VSTTDETRAPKGRAPHRRDENARIAVLHAADDLLVERGFNGVTVEGIAARAGVAKQTIYRWWPSKTDILLDTLIDDAGHELAIPATGPAIETTRRYLRALARFLTKEAAGKVLLALIGAAQHDAAMASAFHQRYLDPQRQNERAMLQRGIASGELPAELDIDAALDALCGPVFYRALTGAPIPRAFIDGLIEGVLEQKLRGCHVHKAAVVALERHSHRRRRTVPVLGHDQVRLSRPRRLLFVRIFPVQENYNVGILFYTIMQVYPICYEIVRFVNCSVIDRLKSHRFYGDDPVPIDVIRSEHFEFCAVEHVSNAPNARPCRADAGIEISSATAPNRHLHPMQGYRALFEHAANPVPYAAWNRVEPPGGPHSLEPLCCLFRREASFAVYSYFFDEAVLCVYPGNIYRPLRRTAILVADLPYPTNDAETEEQHQELARQFLASGGVVDPYIARLGDGHRAIGCPQVAEEECKLILRQGKNGLWDEFLVAA